MADATTKSVIVLDEQDTCVTVQAVTYKTAPGVLFQVDSGNSNHAIRLTADEARALAMVLDAAAAVSAMDAS